MLHLNYSAHWGFRASNKKTTCLDWISCYFYFGLRHECEEIWDLTIRPRIRQHNGHAICLSQHQLRKTSCDFDNLKRLKHFPNILPNQFWGKDERRGRKRKKWDWITFWIFFLWINLPISLASRCNIKGIVISIKRFIFNILNNDS